MRAAVWAHSPEWLPPPGSAADKRSAPLWQVLSSVSDRLGFDVVDDAALKELVPARITKPASKVGVLRVLDEVEV